MCNPTPELLDQYMNEIMGSELTKDFERIYQENPLPKMSHDGKWFWPTEARP